MKLANRSNVYTSVSIVFDNRENCKQCQPSLNRLVSTGVPALNHKYLDTITPNCNYPKSWKCPFDFLMMFLKKGWLIGKQCRPWSNCSFRSCLIKVCSVCSSISVQILLVNIVTKSGKKKKANSSAKGGSLICILLFWENGYTWKFKGRQLLLVPSSFFLSNSQGYYYGKIRCQRE